MHRGYRTGRYRFSEQLTHESSITMTNFKLYRHTVFTTNQYPVSVYTQRLSNSARITAAKALIGMLLNIDACEYTVHTVEYARDVSGGYVHNIVYTLNYDTDETRVTIPMYTSEVMPLC
jgi:hypothetical protein